MNIKLPCMDVQRIKNTGALVIIMTNCSEQCMWYEMSMNVCGTTSYNPYNTDCMVEESSGGEGLINRAACSMFGIGSDIGGGFRMPPPPPYGIFSYKHLPNISPQMV